MFAFDLEGSSPLFPVIYTLSVHSILFITPLRRCFFLAMKQAKWAITTQARRVYTNRLRGEWIDLIHANRGNAGGSWQRVPPALKPGY